VDVVGHIAARLRATTANLSADLHFIAIKSLAGDRAGFADLGARGAFSQMMFRAAHHEVGGSLARLDAVVHQKGVLVRHMGAALIEAVVEEGILAGIAALPAQFDANLDMFGMISHGKTPYMTRNCISCRPA
jgi:hypothetical protein